MLSNERKVLFYGDINVYKLAIPKEQFKIFYHY